MEETGIERFRAWTSRFIKRLVGRASGFALPTQETPATDAALLATSKSGAIQPPEVAGEDPHEGQKPPQNTERAGQIIYEWVNESLKAATGRQASFATRASGIVTSSGAILALILTAISLITKVGGNKSTNLSEINPITAYILAASAIALFLSCIFGITVSASRKVQHANVIDAEKYRYKKNWELSGDAARRAILPSAIKQWESLLKENVIRSRRLNIAAYLEVFGIVLMGISIVVQLILLR